MGDEVCPCCGERYERSHDSMEVVCACEWDGCDENCPHVGHLYREESTA